MHGERTDWINRLLEMSFKAGWMIIVLGLTVYFAGALSVLANVTPDLNGIWSFFIGLPAWLQLIVSGIAIVLAAVVLGGFKEIIRDLAGILYPSEPY